MRKRNTTRNNNTVPGFLSKTYKILENPEYVDIISWNEDGKAFKVKKPNEFAEKVLPKYFKTNNFASFVRQLNMYDFHKLRHDSEENEWRHRLFRRGYPNLLCEIKRKINEQQAQDQVVTQKEQKKITSDTQYLLKEMVSLKQKQESLEKACSVLIAQNTQILGENKLLWGELSKKKDKSQKKIEKLLSLVLNYLGPKQIPELAFLNGKKPNDFLKQEDISDNENEDIHDMISASSGGNRSNLANSKRWDGNDIANSLNGFQFNNNNNNNLNRSFNGGSNVNNLLNSQNGNELQMVPNDHGEQFAQKLLDKLMVNLKNKQDNKNSQQGMSQQKGAQFTNFVDTFHKSNHDLLQNLTNLMNNRNGPSDLSSLELNNQINQATMNNGASTDLQKRSQKKMIGNFNPNMSIGMGAEDLENINDSFMLGKNKKFKKDDDGVVGSRLGSVNQNGFGNNFNLEDLLNNQQLNGSNLFNAYGDLNSVRLNNKASLDFNKLFANDYQPLALPHSTTNQSNSPSHKKSRNNKAQFTDKENQQIASLIKQSGLNQGMGMNDSLQEFGLNGNPNASTFNSNPHQQTSQWEDFNKFIAEQKIEESLNNTHSNTNNSVNLNNNNITNNNSHMLDGNDEFLAKDSINKLNESMI